MLDALRVGQFFVTTGEVLVPGFTVNGRKSGACTTVVKGRKAEVRLDLKRTFPLAYAEIIAADGHKIKRRESTYPRSGLSEESHFKIDADVTGQCWLRLEVWDVATNGEFTLPVWLNQG